MVGAAGAERWTGNVSVGDAGAGGTLITAVTPGL